MSKKILIVDDSSSNLLLISNFLESEGFDVTTCVKGREALSQLAKDKPDLLMLDLMMPDVDGLTILDSIRKNPETTSLPVVVVSAVGDGEKKDGAYKLGISGYISKPIDFELIYQTVAKALKV